MGERMEGMPWRWDLDPAGVLDLLIKRSRAIKKVKHPARRPQDPAAWGEIIRHLQAAKTAAGTLYKGSLYRRKK